jgi:hypothetical protein
MENGLTQTEIVVYRIVEARVIRCFAAASAITVIATFTAFRTVTILTTITALAAVITNITRVTDILTETITAFLTIQALATANTWIRASLSTTADALNGFGNISQTSGPRLKAQIHSLTTTPSLTI